MANRKRNGTPGAIGTRDHLLGRLLTDGFYEAIIRVSEESQWLRFPADSCGGEVVDAFRLGRPCRISVALTLSAHFGRTVQRPARRRHSRRGFGLGLRLAAMPHAAAAAVKFVSAGKNRFPQPHNRFVRAIAGTVRTKIVPCGHFPLRAAKLRSVRAIGFPCGSAFRPCGRKPICAAIFRSVQVKTSFFKEFSIKMVSRPPSSRPSPPGRR
jgi:hypothetical protein